MAYTMWDGHMWDITTTEVHWVLSRTVRNRMQPVEVRAPRAECPTLESALAWLDARDIAKRAAESAAYKAKEAAKAAPLRTPSSQSDVGAVIGAIERGIPVEQIEAAVEGRAYKSGQTVLRCPKCRATGYTGSYPFSTGYGSLCDDCGA